jgi:hypothetical protein
MDGIGWMGGGVEMMEGEKDERSERAELGVLV